MDTHTGIWSYIRTWRRDSARSLPASRRRDRTRGAPAGDLHCIASSLPDVAGMGAGATTDRNFHAGIPLQPAVMVLAWRSGSRLYNAGDAPSLWLLPHYRLCLSAGDGWRMAELPRSLPESEA